MQLILHPSPPEWPGLLQRPVADSAPLEKKVRRMMQKIKAKGDKALRKFTHELDGVRLKKTLVTPKEMRRAEQEISDELKTAIQQARNNIEIFHKAQQSPVTIISPVPGVDCWRQSVPIEKVGLYIPGGSAPLFSTLLMLAVPAQLAGCRDIIICTPPSPEGNIHPAILYAASLCGVTAVYKAGGVQAIAAMCYGTETIPRVHKIFGPGNQYVTFAKQLAQTEGVAIDMPAGPSEVLVIADETAIPAFVSADLLSQAEHGADSQVILLTPSETVARQVVAEMEEQLKKLPRKEIAIQVLRHSKAIVVNDLDTAMEISNRYAPEHLILACEDALNRSRQVTAAGSVFIGHYSPESAGDYASGTNHTLPTNGYAAMYSGVSLDSFVKKITYQQLTKEGLQRIGQTVMTMAAAEGLDAHREAVAIRLNK